MRKKRKYKKYYEPDIKYNSVAAGRFINYLMRDGKKTVAEKIFYSALDQASKELGEEPMKIFEKAIANVSPSLEVVSRRIGGANYQIPQEVQPDRRFVLASKWIIQAARARKGMPMAKRLANELVAAFKEEGEAVKKKQNTHRMAEANRAFAHFARKG